jgi:hypothetical protein
MGANEAADSSVCEFSDAPPRIAKAQIRLVRRAALPISSCISI